MCIDLHQCTLIYTDMQWFTLTGMVVMVVLTVVMSEISWAHFWWGFRFCWAPNRRYLCLTCTNFNFCSWKANDHASSQSRVHLIPVDLVEDQSTNEYHHPEDADKCGLEPLAIKDIWRGFSSYQGVNFTENVLRIFSMVRVKFRLSLTSAVAGATSTVNV